MFHPLRLRRYDRSLFWGRVWGYELGPIRMLRIEAGASTAVRTPATIAAFDPELFEFAIQLRGQCHVAQGQRDAVLSPGDLSAHETSHPYTVSAAAPFELLLVMAPRHLVSPHAERISKQTAMRMPGGEGLVGLVVPFVCRLVEGLDRGSIGTGETDLAQSVLDLMRSLYLRGAFPAPGTPPRSRAALLARIKTFIEANLGDPELDPERIARASFVSVRYLHKLFEHEGTTVCEWIRERRLERCCRDLGNPLLRDEPILAIASRWGFTSSAHFSRLFRSRYGVSPRQFRRFAEAGGPGVGDCTLWDNFCALSGKRSLPGAA